MSVLALSFNWAEEGTEITDPKKKVFICANCNQLNDLSHRTTMPYYNTIMEKVVTSYICPNCVSLVSQIIRTYASKAFTGTPFQEDGGLKENEVIEDFVAFFLPYDPDFAIQIRYSTSTEGAVQSIEQYLDKIESGSINLIDWEN